MIFAVGGLTAIAMTAALAMPASAVAQSLERKKVEWVIPFSESGGSAVWAIFFASLLGEALPGQPTVVVRYRPGGGSTTGANWFQENRGSGGSTLLFGTAGSTLVPCHLGDPLVRNEYKDSKDVPPSGTGGVVYLRPIWARATSAISTFSRTSSSSTARRARRRSIWCRSLRFSCSGIRSIRCPRSKAAALAG